MIELVMAAALLVQQQGEVVAEQVMRSVDGMVDDLEDLPGELDLDPGAENTARALVRVSEAVFANSPFDVFSLSDRDRVIGRLTPELDALLTYAEGNPSDYSLDFAVHAFRLSDGENSDYAFCDRDGETTVVDEMGTDPEGNVLTYRVCWFGRMGEEEGELIGSYLHQLSNGDYHVQYRSGIVGPDEAGIGARLPMTERMIEPLVRHTVIAPSAE